MVKRMVARLLAVAISAGVAACSSIGPSSVRRDQADYGVAIGDSWKQQTLMNIVRLRYSDVPMFMEVSQVIAGYQLQTTAQAGLNVANYITAGEGTPPPGVLGQVGAGVTYTDRPTVVYAPLTGNEFMKKLMSPLPPGAVLSLLQSGYPATMVLPLAVDSINGIANGSRRPEMSRAADPQFGRLAELLLELQRSNDVQVQTERRKDGTESSVVVFRDASGGGSNGSEVRQLLRLSGPGPYAVRSGGYGGKSNEISIVTRSMLQIMVEVGTFTDVPQRDLDDGRASPLGSEAVASQQAALLQIHSGPAPASAHVSVQYKGRWFWIADNDVRSKSVLASLMLLSAISDGGGRPAPPVVTIPAN